MGLGLQVPSPHDLAATLYYWGCPYKKSHHIGLLLLQLHFYFSLFSTNSVTLSAVNQGTVILFFINNIKLSNIIWTAHTIVFGPTPAVSVVL